MYISEVCIKRPVLATVLNLIIILAGILSFLKLPVRGTPNVNPPVISIESYYPGASPGYIEKNITTVLERAIKNVKNLDYISSASSSGFSQITVVFKLEADLDEALNDIRSKVSEVTNYLPKDLISPSISKMDLDNFPSIWISTSGKNYDTMFLTDIVKQRIQPEIEKLESVSKSLLYSSATYAIQVNLDPVRMYKFGISPFEIKTKISSENRDFAAGGIKTDYTNFVLKLEGTLSTPEEFENIIIGEFDGKLLKLKEVADVILKPVETDNLIRYNGSETVTLGVIKSSKSNSIELSDQLNKLMPKLQASLPDGVILNIAYDNSVPIRASINSVYMTAFEALILVMLIVYLFLGNIFATIIPFVAIPVSLIGTFAFMEYVGFSINLYSLLAMIMAIGLVVDDAIVCLENIYHHIENGLSPLDATYKAVREIGFAIVAMTITLASVFLPIGFLEGFIGKLFIEFAWTLAFCVIVSGFVALTLSPVLSVKILKKSSNEDKPKFIIKFDKKLDELRNKYKLLLHDIVINPKKLYYVAGGSILVLILSFYFVKKEFLPSEDDSIILISGTGPEGSSVSTSVEVIKEVEKIVSIIPEVNGYFFNANQNKVFGFVPLVAWGNRDKSQAEVIKFLNPIISNIPGMSLFAFGPGPMRGSFEKPVTLHLLSYGNFDDLIEISEKFKKEAEKAGIFYNIESNLKDSMPTIEVNVNREIAAKYNVYIEHIGSTLQLLLSNYVVSDFTIGNETYDVVMGFAKNDRSKLSDISKIYVKSLDGEMIHISNFAQLNETLSIQAYHHYNTAKSIKLSAELSPGSSLSDAKKKLDEIADKLVDKSLVSVVYDGDIKRMAESNSGILITFMLAIFFIYLVLSAQFESFIDPFIIILAVPFSITGGILGLIIGGSSMNLYSNIGIITLIGLITKNSILIVEFANQLLKENKSKIEAVITASSQRLRPILMTSLATILGAVPLVIASGAAAESRRSIGLIVVFGMLIGTIFTLFVIPTIYYRVKK